MASAGLALASPRVFYRAALGLQVLFYLLAAAGWLGRREGRPSRLTSVPYTLVLLNLAAASALLGIVRGTETAAWKASP